MSNAQFLTSFAPNIQAGSGRIVLGGQGRHVAFSELSSAYPLKLLSPRIVQNKVAVVYVLTYGGGLVGGDQLQLCVDVQDDAVLVLLSQVRVPSPPSPTLLQP